jgi:hypothetical protein
MKVYIFIPIIILTRAFIAARLKKGKKHFYPNYKYITSIVTFMLTGIAKHDVEDMINIGHNRDIEASRVCVSSM